MITIHSYTATTWTNGVTVGSGGVSGTMTNIETGISNVVSDLSAHQTAATLDHPNGSVLAAHLAAGAATDTVIGNRTPDQTVAAATGAQPLTTIFNMIANRIKAITGGTNWYDAVPNSLSNLNGRVTTLETTPTTATADPTQVPSSNGPGTLTQIFSWLANRLLAHAGTTNWYDAPRTTLANAVKLAGDTMTGGLTISLGANGDGLSMQGTSAYVNLGSSATGPAGVISSNQSLVALVGGSSYFGVKLNNGTKLAQMGNIPSHGVADMAIGGTTYWTTQASAGFNNSASFSSFDIAEVYRVDRAYDGGTVVCPHGEEMRRCEHDACAYALIVSKSPGFAIGDPFTVEDGPAESLALAGRVRAVARGEIRARQFVCADGAGGVRPLADGETAYALGYALHDATGGRVGILLRAGTMTGGR